MRKFAVVLTAFLALVLAASCVKLERQPVEKRFYALEAVRPDSAAGESSSTLSTEPTTS